MAVKYKNINSMHNIAIFYYNFKNSKLMKKYLKMALKNNHVLSMCFMGYYYKENNDIIRAKKYFDKYINNKINFYYYDYNIINWCNQYILKNIK